MLPGELVLVKRRFSAFFATHLDLLLRRLGTERLVVCGVQTPNCIRATAFDAVSLDYHQVVCSVAVCVDMGRGGGPVCVCACVRVLFVGGRIPAGQAGYGCLCCNPRHTHSGSLMASHAGVALPSAHPGAPHPTPCHACRSPCWRMPQPPPAQRCRRPTCSTCGKWG